MTIQDWASLIVALLTIFSSVAFGIKWLVKHYLAELKTNGGSSMRDEIKSIKHLNCHFVVMIISYLPTKIISSLLYGGGRSFLRTRLIG